MTKNVKIIETVQGFTVRQGTKTCRPTRVLHELAAVLELVEAEYVSWQFLGNLDDPEVLDAATEVINDVGNARSRLQRLLTADARSARATKAHSVA